jgi:hypothetical protein
VPRSMSGNPIVVMCTHNRIGITSYNLISILSQSVKPKVVLVVSTIQERIHFEKTFPEVIVLIHGNTPLGAKWQFGAQHAYSLQADPLIILGSDDILGEKYIEICSELTAEKHDFIGLYSWYVHYKGKAFLCKYLAKQPLGGGRSYSLRLLNRLGGRLFNPKLNRHLDDHAIIKCREFFIPCHTDSRLVVHAIKGDWACMNPFNLKHRNIQVISEYKTSDFFQDLCVDTPA